MKITLHLDDDLIARAKKLAAKERRTLSKLVEEGIALRLESAAPASGTARAADLPVSKCRGGLRQGVNGTSNRSMFDAEGG